MMQIHSEKRQDKDGVIRGFTPLSFGVMVRIDFINDTLLAAGTKIRLVHNGASRQVETTVVNVEKDYTVYITPVEFNGGETGNVVLDYTDELLRYPLSGAGVMAVHL